MEGECINSVELSG